MGEADGSAGQNWSRDRLCDNLKKRGLFTVRDRKRPASRSIDGFAFVYALMGIAIVSITFYVLSSFVSLHSKFQGQNISILRGRMILHSLVDYTVLAVKQHWCLGSSWIPERPCGFDHPRAIDRLILNPDSERLIRAMQTDDNLTFPNPLRLEEISAVINIDDILENHPLHAIIEPARGKPQISRIFLSIKRDDSARMATSGREVFVRVEAELQDDGGKTALWGGLPLRMTSEIGVFPRELGSLTLLIANDLHLDRPFQPLERGNGHIHQFTGAGAMAGLVFESPVFVNGNIFLPEGAPPGQARSGRHAPVTFADKVYLGGGAVYRAGEFFKPRTAGRSDDQLWADIPEFGGFQKGFESDGARDPGLDVLAGLTQGREVQTPLMKLCADLIGSQSVLSKTNNAELTGMPISGNLDQGVTYRLGFGDSTTANRQSMNMFIPQTENVPLGQVKFDPGKLKLTPLQYAFAPRPVEPGTVATVSLIIDNQEAIVANMGYDTSFTTTYRPKPSDKLGDLKKDIDDLDKKIRDEKDPNKKKSLEADRDRKRGEAAKLEENSKKVVNIEVAVKPVLSPTGIQPVFLDLVVRATPAGDLIDGDGKNVDAAVKVKVYDIGCHQGKCRDAAAPKTGLVGAILNNIGLGNNSGGLGKNDKWSNVGFISLTAGTPAQGVAASQRGAPRPLPIADPNQDYAKLMDTCTYEGQAAYGGIDWKINFTEATRNSWSFTQDSAGNPLVPPPELVLNNLNAGSTPPSGTFHLRSIVGTCRVQGTATQVAGFLVCDRMIIEPRTQPLTMIGTFIVSNLQIDPSAYQAGIRWRSIYHPTSTTDLRRSGVLSPEPGYSCENMNNPPWNPFPSLLESANRWRCNVGSLRARSEAFTWTSVDPDCGVPAGGAQFVCKHQLTRFQVIELSRESRL